MVMKTFMSKAEAQEHADEQEEEGIISFYLLKNGEMCAYCNTIDFDHPEVCRVCGMGIHANIEA